MKKQRAPHDTSSTPVNPTGHFVAIDQQRLAAIGGGTGTWKLGNKEWNDDWLAPK